MLRRSQRACLCEGSEGRFWGGGSKFFLGKNNLGKGLENGDVTAVNWISHSSTCLVIKQQDVRQNRQSADSFAKHLTEDKDLSNDSVPKPAKLAGQEKMDSYTPVMNSSWRDKVYYCPYFQKERKNINVYWIFAVQGIPHCCPPQKSQKWGDYSYIPFYDKRKLKFLAGDTLSQRLQW